jgi:type I restriction enzyme S subunit
MNNWNLHTIDKLKGHNKTALAIGPFGSRMKRDCYVKKGVPVIRGNNIPDHPGFFGEFVFISEDKAVELGSSQVYENDLVFPHRGNIGEVGLVQGSLFEKYVISTSLMKLTCNKRIVNPKFLYYFFRSRLGRKKLLQNASQVGTPGIATPLTSLRNIEVLLPPIEEQKSIAAVLSCLDRKIENLRKQNETLEAIAQTLFKRWFIDFEFPYDFAQGKPSPDGQPYKSSGGAMQPSELGEIPEGWRVEILGNLCTIFRGSSPRPISSPVFFEGGHIPWIKIADATRSSSIYLSETKEHCTEAALPFTRLLKKGDLILSNSATIGVPMILNLEGCIHDGWLSFKDYKNITRNFLFFALIFKINFLLQYADGSVQKNLNTGILREMELVLPTSHFISEFTELSQSLFDKILVNEKQIQILTKTRDTLLPKLMNGQLRITP